MKSVLLARVSTKEQEEGYSLDAQTARLREYCQRNNLQIEQEYTIVESSTRGERTEFVSMLRDIERSRDRIALVCDKVDRLHRNFDYLSRLKKLISAGRMEIHSVGDSCILTKDSDHHAWLLFNLMTLLAQNYTDAISYNVKRSIKHRTEKGEWSSKAPVGYLNVRDENQRAMIVVDPYKAPLIKRLFAHYATGKYSMSQLGKLCAEWGLYAGKMPRPMPKSRIYELLTNPFYYGEMKSNGILMPHVYEPLITRDLWDECDRIRRGVGKKAFKYRDKPFLYRGIINCARTGRLVSTQRHKGRYNYLACWDANEKMQYFREEIITEQIARILDDLQLPPDKLDDIAKFMKTTKAAESDFHDSEVRRLRVEQTKAEDRRKNLIEMYLDKAIDKEVYDEKLNELNRRRADISRHISAHESADDNFNEKLVTLFTTAAGYGDDWRHFAESMAKMPDGETKSSKIAEGIAFLKAVFRTLELKDGNLGFQLHAPFDALLKIQKQTNGGHKGT